MGSEMCIRDRNKLGVVDMSSFLKPGRKEEGEKVRKKPDIYIGLGRRRRNKKSREELEEGGIGVGKAFPLFLYGQPG